MTLTSLNLSLSVTAFGISNARCGIWIKIHPFSHFRWIMNFNYITSRMETSSIIRFRWHLLLWEHFPCFQFLIEMFLNLAVQDDIFHAGICFWMLIIITTNFIQLFSKTILGTNMLFFINIKTLLTFSLRQCSVFTLWRRN